MRRRPPALDLDGQDLAVLLFDDVGPRDQPEPLRAQLDRPRLPEWRIAGLAHQAPAGIDGTMNVDALHRVLVVLEARLHPLQVEQTLAVLELVDHTSRNKFGNVAHAEPESPLPTSRRLASSASSVALFTLPDHTRRAERSKTLTSTSDL